MALALIAVLGLSACGGGSSGNNRQSSNRAPVANAGADQNVQERSAVVLSGSGSDVDGDVLTYAWTQTGGPTVTITNANAAQAGFTAPDVAAGAPERLTFQLSVSDGSLNDTDTVDVTVSEPVPTVLITGALSYESVPVSSNCRGLNFNGAVDRPIRGATLQLLDDATGAVLASAVLADDGSYAFAGIAADTMVRLRVLAELKKTTGLSRWDVEVRDNYDDTPPVPVLAERPLYAVEWDAFDTGSAATNTVNRTAASGWGGTSYTGERAAAPFSILDMIYAANRFTEAADPDVILLPLDVFWSVNNTVDISEGREIDLGRLGTSFYSGSIDSLFLVGDAATDTEEFDGHVVLHEWGHYFEDVLSRSDSIGGPHRLGESLDARLAFGEGWASALASMILDNPVYCDTRAAGSSALGLTASAESGNIGVPGWFNEWNVTTFVYDLWDDANDGSDTGSLGWTPIYAVMRGAQATTEAFTSLFSFATELRADVDVAGQALIDSQLGRYNVISGADLDIWATNETNDAGITPSTDVFPLYTNYVADGSVLPICVNSQLDGLDRDGNNVAEDRYLRLTIPVTGRYDVSMVTTTATPATPETTDRDQSDPDIYIYAGPVYIVEGTSPVENSETFRTPVLTAGTTYIAAIEEWRFDDDEANADFPSRICFDISFTSVP